MNLLATKPLAVTAYYCGCGQPVYFRNSKCLFCGSALGYDPAHDLIRRLHSLDNGTWRGEAGPGDDGAATTYRRCANLEEPAACNWLIDTSQPVTSAYCLACRLNRTIPNLSIPGNAGKWLSIEMAKRRLVSSLLRRGLPVEPRASESSSRGLAFDFLAPEFSSTGVLTGHADGIITLNTDEADAAVREKARAGLQERYRTILGHLRHETGHYYWEVLVRDEGSLEAFRELFGDERQSYQEALYRYYQNGAPTGWESGYISAYATAHPWEDWAECWAHYLHMTDTLETASRVGLAVEACAETAPDGGLTGESPFQEMSRYWIQLTIAVNEISEAMGNECFYPFTLSTKVIRKLEFVHDVVSRRRAGTGR